MFKCYSRDGCIPGICFAIEGNLCKFSQSCLVEHRRLFLADNRVVSHCNDCIDQPEAPNKWHCMGNWGSWHESVWGESPQISPWMDGWMDDDGTSDPPKLAPPPSCLGHEATQDEEIKASLGGDCHPLSSHGGPDRMHRTCAENC